MSRKYEFKNPFFNEYVFHCIVTATEEQKSNLPFDLYAFAHKENKAKDFADNASMEKKMAMLMHLGVGVSIWFAPPEFMNTTDLRATYDEYLSNKRKDSQMRMIKNKSFVMTDRDTMAQLVMMAQNCHDETFIMNRDYFQITEKLTLASEAKLDSVELARPAMVEFSLLCKFLLSVFKHHDHSEGPIGYNEVELSILLYLFVHRQAYIDQKNIANYLTPTYSKQQTRTSLIRLRQRRLIDLLPSTNHLVRKFSIASLGIKAIGNYLNRIVNETFNG